MSMSSMSPFFRTSPPMAADGIVSVPTETPILGEFLTRFVICLLCQPRVVLIEALAQADLKQPRNFGRSSARLYRDRCFFLDC
jgi:hypothetical protein